MSEPKPTDGDEAPKSQPPTRVNAAPRQRVTIMQATVTLLVVTVIATLVRVFLKPGVFFDSLRDPDFARGVITFMVSFSALSLGFIVVLYAMLSQADPKTGETRFRWAREIFVALMGVLGTIVGFYFGNADSKSQSNVALSTIRVEGGTEMIAFASGGTAPYRYELEFGLVSGKENVSKESTDGMLRHSFAKECEESFTLVVRDANGHVAFNMYTPPPKSSDP